MVQKRIPPKKWIQATLAEVWGHYDLNTELRSALPPQTLVGAIVPTKAFSIPREEVVGNAYARIAHRKGSWAPSNVSFKEEEPADYSKKLSKTMTDLLTALMGKENFRAFRAACKTAEHLRRYVVPAKTGGKSTLFWPAIMRAPFSVIGDVFTGLTGSCAGQVNGRFGNHKQHGSSSVIFTGPRLKNSSYLWSAKRDVAKKVYAHPQYPKMWTYLVEEAERLNKAIPAYNSDWGSLYRKVVELPVILWTPTMNVIFMVPTRVPMTKDEYHNRLWLDYDWNKYRVLFYVNADLVGKLPDLSKMERGVLRSLILGT